MPGRPLSEFSISALLERSCHGIVQSKGTRGGGEVPRSLMYLNILTSLTLHIQKHYGLSRRPWKTSPRTKFYWRFLRMSRSPSTRQKPRRLYWRYFKPVWNEGSCFICIDSLGMFDFCSDRIRMWSSCITSSRKDPTIRKPGTIVVLGRIPSLNYFATHQTWGIGLIWPSPGMSVSFLVAVLIIFFFLVVQEF